MLCVFGFFDPSKNIASSHPVASQVLVVLCFLRPFTLILKRLGQPGVIAELVGGIILGPSLMGLIPGFSDTLFPSSSLSYFKLVADVGKSFRHGRRGIRIHL